MSEPTYRYAREQDLDPLHALIERAYRGPETAGRWDSESHLLRGPRTTRDFVHNTILSPDAAFVIAELDGQIMGAALIERPADAAAGVASFGMFAISPNARGIGLGDRVLAACEDRVRSLWQATAMSLSVISLRDELMAWYERRGYARTGVRHPFPFSETTGELRNDFDLVEMRKDFA